MKMRLLICVVVCFGITGLMSCSTLKEGSKKDDITGEWKLLSVRTAEGVLTPAPDGKNIPTLTVSPEGRVSGSTGCNNYTGTVAVKGSTLQFSRLVSTRKFCLNMDMEDAMIKAVSSSDNYIMEKGNLALRKGKEVTAVFSSR